MGAYTIITDGVRARPRVVVVGLASCFGCQLQITNDEPHLVELLNQIDLEYWQLVSSAEMPEHYDVAIVEGSVTTRENEELLVRVRERAAHVMAIGACATTGGVTGMASDKLEERIACVYGESASLPASCGEALSARPVSDVIAVDSVVRCCPIDPHDFARQLQQVLFGSNAVQPERTLCADCKRNETECFYNLGTLCMGLVTRAGCGARCVNLGRACMGCAGLSDAANVDAARVACETYGIDAAAFDATLRVFNQVQLGQVGVADAAAASGAAGVAGATNVTNAAGATNAANAANAADAASPTTNATDSTGDIQEDA